MLERAAGEGAGHAEAALDCAARGRPVPDRLTILRGEPAHPAAKLVRLTDGAPDITTYSGGTWFSAHELEVAGIAALARKLDAVSEDHLAFVIRGEPVQGVDRSRCRRTLHQQPDGTPPAFRNVPRRWLLLDFDQVPGPYRFDVRNGEHAGWFCRAKLPPEFHNASFWWQLTASAGIKPGVRLRMAFWLDRPVSEAELKRWLAAAPVDHAIFGAVQPIYVARPGFMGGADPIKVRSGLEEDVEDVVRVPPLPEPAPAPRAAASPFRWFGPRATPMARLEDVAAKVAQTGEAGTNHWGGAGRHHGLYCAALCSSRAIVEGELSAGDVEHVLTAAARASGLKDKPDISRTIRNAFRQGGVR